MLIITIFYRCDEVYDYDLNDTTWFINSYWFDGFYQGEPNEISFYKDGTTSWGGQWEYTDELTFKWVVPYQNDTMEYTATYYGQFRKDLNLIKGRSENDMFGWYGYQGEFYGYKLSDEVTQLK